ncbi:MAG: cbb3-type cytochrome c oxidase subunit I [ANME-2 cluster archaeon]|nr:cbb3-type cytochrome c oxidase subunit I [ANME-2 cluster archaeon]
MGIETKFIKASLVYFTISVLLGASYTVKPIHDFIMNSGLFAGAHSHIALLGWVTFALMGILYHAVPNITGNPIKSERCVNIQFWLMNIGVAAMFVLILYAAYTEAGLVRAGEVTQIESALGPIMPLIMLSGIVTFIASLLFVNNIYKLMK